MRVELIEHPGDEWDQFAESHPEGRLGHAGQWHRVLAEAYGLAPLYLGARDTAGALCGLLPMVAFKSRPGGRARLVSLPFLDVAGVLARDGDAGEALWRHALVLCRERGFDGVELRTTRPAEDANASSGLDRVNLVLALEQGEQSQWKALSAKVRNQCRKAEREGLELLTGGPEAARQAFLAPYRENMRDLGSPPHSERFFDAIARHFGARLRFVATSHAGRAVGGLVAIRFGSRVYVPWASTLRSERNRCPNNRIYWEAIRWAIGVGATAFDFGRSPREGGTFRFKKGWGAVEEELDWRRFDREGRGEPVSAGGQGSVLRALSQVWTRLPVPVADVVGSRIRRYFSN